MAFGVTRQKPKRGRKPDARQMMFDFEGDYRGTIRNHHSEQNADRRGNIGSADRETLRVRHERSHVRDLFDESSRDLRSDNQRVHERDGNDPHSVSRSNRVVTVPNKTSRKASPVCFVDRTVRPAPSQGLQPVASVNQPVVPSAPRPPGSTGSLNQFKLPFGTTPSQLRDPKFVELSVFDKAIKTGSATLDERKHVFALVNYVLRSEQETPAKLLTHILRGGKRKSPWRGDLAEQDFAWATTAIRSLDVPKEMTVRTGNLGEVCGEDERARQRRLAASRPDLFARAK